MRATQIAAAQLKEKEAEEKAKPEKTKKHHAMNKRQSYAKEAV